MICLGVFLLGSPAVSPGLSMRECGATGCYPRSACPILRHSESGPLGLCVRECRAAGCASGRTACPPSCHTPPVSVPPRQCESSPPWLPSPPLLPVWMNVYFFISLLSYFLVLPFSVSSGCVRRRSVSTYAAILVLCVEVTSEH